MPARVPQSPVFASSAGKGTLEAEQKPEGPANRGGLFFDYFLLAVQKKVTSRRAAPGEVEVALSLLRVISPRNGFAPVGLQLYMRIRVY